MNIYNCFLTTKSLVPGELVQGTVSQIESKGYMIDLHTHDSSQAFIKFSDVETKLSINDRVYITILEKQGKQGIVKAKLASNADRIDYSSTLSFEQIKPGFKVECKVTKIVDNGIHVLFCNGVEGVIFDDHLTQKYKNKDILDARVTYIDYQKK